MRVGVLRVAGSQRCYEGGACGGSCAVADEADATGRQRDKGGQWCPVVGVREFGVPGHGTA
ncbi:hypothetical protein BAW75_31110 [Micromonospora chalcea]|nr:hypothetical protein BAW75_31110 [Micromonospora chalcea]